jgi:hypothetical protein
MIATDTVVLVNALSEDNEGVADEQMCDVLCEQLVDACVRFNARSEELGRILTVLEQSIAYGFIEWNVGVVVLWSVEDVI